MFEQILSSSTIRNNLENSEENTLYVYIGAFRLEAGSSIRDLKIPWTRR